MAIDEEEDMPVGDGDFDEEEMPEGDGDDDEMPEGDDDFEDDPFSDPFFNEAKDLTFEQARALIEEADETLTEAIPVNPEIIKLLEKQYAAEQAVLDNLERQQLIDEGFIAPESGQTPPNINLPDTPLMQQTQEYLDQEEEDLASRTVPWYDDR